MNAETTIEFQIFHAMKLKAIEIELPSFFLIFKRLLIRSLNFVQDVSITQIFL